MRLLPVAVSKNFTRMINTPTATINTLQSNLTEMSSTIGNVQLNSNENQTRTVLGGDIRNRTTISPIFKRTTTSLMTKEEIKTGDTMNEMDFTYVSRNSLILVAMGILILIVTIVMIGWFLKRRQRNRAAYLTTANVPAFVWSAHSEPQLGNIIMNESFQFLEPHREIVALPSTRLTNERGTVQEEILMQELSEIYLERRD